MPDTVPPTRQRFKFALLAALGLAMVLLPLGQVLRYQNAELDQLLTQRAVLDPMAQALSVQRGLIGHRDASDRVLVGRFRLEAERRLRQAEVDHELWALQGTLSSGMWVRALGEAAALAQDWRGLTGRIAQRQIDVQQSRHGHQLLIEQAVQVMDLVSGQAPAGSVVQAAALQLRTQGAGSNAGDLAEVELLLAAHDSQLRQRSADLRAQRSALIAAFAAIAALGTAALAMLFRGAPLPPGQTPAGGDGVRRSAGRRGNDAAQPAAESLRLMARLRESADAADATPPYPPHAPRSPRG